jgi:hypothetical protein
MKKLNMFYICVLFVVSTGCGLKLKQNIDLNPEVPGLGSINPPKSRNFTNSELEIGRRICSNAKKKREFFETLSNDKEQVRLRSEFHDCDDVTYYNKLIIASISIANSTMPEYVAVNEHYFKDIVTDQSGTLKTLCDSMTSSDLVANNILSGNFRFVINFLIADGLDTFQVSKSQKQADGSYNSVSSESISFITNTNQAASKFFGVEKERVRFTACEGKKFNTQRQTWIEAITDFKI